MHEIVYGNATVNVHVQGYVHANVHVNVHVNVKVNVNVNVNVNINIFFLKKCKRMKMYIYKFYYKSKKI